MILTPNHHPVNRERLVAWYNYRNTGSVSATGTWKDYSGNGNNGTLTGNAYVDNNGVNLDGTGDYISTPINTAKLDINQPHSYCVWLNLNADTGGYQSIIYLGNVSAYAPLYHFDGIYLNNDFTTLRYTQYDGGEGSATTTISPGSFIFICAVHDGTNLNLYKDGVLVDSVAKRAPNVSSSAVLKIGANQTNGDFFNGIFDDIQIYNRALSAGEVKVNYLKNKRN